MESIAIYFKAFPLNSHRINRFIAIISQKFYKIGFDNTKNEIKIYLIFLADFRTLFAKKHVQKSILQPHPVLENTEHLLNLNWRLEIKKLHLFLGFCTLK